MKFEDMQIGIPFIIESEGEQFETIKFDNGDWVGINLAAKGLDNPTEVVNYMVHNTPPKMRYSIIEYFELNKVVIKNCICDFYSQILITGCICGGK